MNDEQHPTEKQDPVAAARRQLGAARTEVTVTGETAGDWIGRYHLLEEIGQGGMGTVWMAEQREPVRRKVALKIIKLGMDTREVVVRFEAERQALALMDHPNIAKVHDGGATETGRPYFVMELVRGVPITDYCDQARLGLRARLELFTRVCEAIQHAHQKGVIHRDVKPSNVLVTLHDGVPVPKVIDFGIAKATSAELTQKTMFTRYAQLIGTPEYMAPEQAEMSGLDIDTRADVYSLGVLLYELLTGTRPFDLRGALEAGYEELLRRIRDVDPPKPSTRVSTLGEQATPIAAQRAVNVESLGRRLRGDLDWIVMKALEKDRTRRYDSASAFAADVERSLRSEPVEAAPPSAVYRFRRFVRRRRKAVVSLGIIGVLFVAGSVGTLLGLLEARDANAALETSLSNEETQRALAEQNAATAGREAERATAEAERAARMLERSEETKGLVLSVLTSVRPYVAAGLDTQLLEAVFEELAARLAAGEIEDPVVAWEMHQTVARSYRGLNRFDAAMFHHHAAVELATESFGPEHEYTLNARLAMAETQMYLGHYREAEEAARSLIAPLERALGEHHLWPLLARRLLGQVLLLQDRAEEAEELLAPVYEDLVASYGAEDEETRIAWRSLVGARVALSGRPESLEDARELAAWHEREYGTEHPYTVDAWIELSVALFHSGQPEEALELSRKATAVSERLHGPGGVDTPRLLFTLAQQLVDAGRPREAFDVYADALERCPRGLDRPLYTEFSLRCAYASALKSSKEMEEARAVLEAVCDPLPTGPLELHELRALCLLMDLCANLGDDERVETILEAALPAMRELAAHHEEAGGRLTFGELQCVSPLSNVGIVWVDRGRHAEALELLELTFSLMRSGLGPGGRSTSMTALARAKALDGLGETEAAVEAWRDYGECMVARMHGGDPPRQRRLNELAWHWMRPPHPELVDLDLALEAATRLVELTDPPNPRYLGTLAIAQIAAEKLEEARDTLETLLAEAGGMPEDFRAAFEAKLDEVLRRLDEDD